MILCNEEWLIISYDIILCQDDGDDENYADEHDNVNDDDEGARRWQC